MNKSLLLDYDILHQELTTNPSLIPVVVKEVNRFEAEYQKAETVLDGYVQQSISLRGSESLRGALQCMISNSGPPTRRQRIMQRVREYFEEEEYDPTPALQMACATVKRIASQLQTHQDLIRDQKDKLEAMHQDYIGFQRTLSQLKMYPELLRKARLMQELIAMQVQSFTVVNLVFADNQHVIDELDAALTLIQPVVHNYKQSKLLHADHRKLISMHQWLKKK